MSLRRFIYVTIAAVTLASPALAAVFVDVDLAPPPPRMEAVPVAQPGYVWAPGYWSWAGHRHVWMPGHWIADRPGYLWVADNWVQFEGRWRYAPGHWDRDPHWAPGPDYHGPEWVRYRHH
jgi:hypothetical protein